MFGFLRLLFGLLLLPACWAVAAVFIRTLSTTGSICPASVSLLAGVAAFLVCWLFLPHPVKTYVFGHELTHALWGLLFGARPSRLRVRENGGSVDLTKSNLLITLAPYFFPFYTVIVLACAGLTLFFVRPLPVIPVWTFLIGFTWSFHLLFTLESLAQTQPDVTLYGRLFSWTFIFLANVLIVLLFLAVATGVGLRPIAVALAGDLTAVYRTCWSTSLSLVHLVRQAVGT